MYKVCLHLQNILTGAVAIEHGDVIDGNGALASCRSPDPFQHDLRANCRYYYYPCCWVIIIITSKECKAFVGGSTRFFLIRLLFFLINQLLL